MIWSRGKVLDQVEVGEDSRVEFKEVAFAADRVREPRREVIANDLATFANSTGGALIFSVSGTGVVQPLNRAQMDALEAFISAICADSIKPNLPFETQRLKLPGGSSVLIVETEQSTVVHQSPGGYLRRQGGSKRNLSPNELRRLFERRSRSNLFGPDEIVIPNTVANTLDAGLVDRFMTSRKTDPVAAQLQKLGLVREDDAGVPRVTIAGALLCTERPEAHIRGAVIEAVRYRGTVLDRASRHDSMTISGPLDRQIRDAVNFVRLNSRVAARKEPGRVEIPQFSPRAVFEAIVNAVVHRDYAMLNTRIRLFIFDDRLELYSPGSLPKTLSIEAMQTRQATRNETLASALRRLEIGDIPGSGDRQYFLKGRGEGVPIIYEETRDLTGHDPRFEVLHSVELRLTLPSAPPPMEGIEGEVSVSADGQPLAGVQIVALYPNKTWMEQTTDASGQAIFGFHSELPITAFCAAPGYRGCVKQNWQPPQPLSVALEPLPAGGSTIFTERTGHVPSLTGRLNPILDNLDRMYLYTVNIAIDNGKQQPVHFKLKQPLQLTDVNGCERIVRFIGMIGKSALLEYEPAEPVPHREDTK